MVAHQQIRIVCRDLLVQLEVSAIAVDEFAFLNIKGSDFHPRMQGLFENLFPGRGVDDKVVVRDPPGCIL